ncbi:MAG: hypothetical protein PWP52_29 [Bacteroidales bacterium]|jgi:uncharacterized membrane protein|nr:hypothetical protein [Bacteroidales bacterium]
MTVQLIINGIFFIFILISGIWLSKLGKPYGTVLFTIHKLIALAFIVYIFILSKGLFKTTELNLVMWIFMVAAALSVVLIFTTGGILSNQEEVKNSLVIVHRISSVVLLLSLTGWFFMALK